MEEVDQYLRARKGIRALGILVKCFQDYNFLSNSTWFIGAIGYCLLLYYDGTVAEVANIVSGSDLIPMFVLQY